MHSVENSRLPGYVWSSRSMDRRSWAVCWSALWCARTSL